MQGSVFSTGAGPGHRESYLMGSCSPPFHASPSFSPFSSPSSLSFFSHSASLLNSALTSALPKTTTKESRSLAVPGRSCAPVSAESGVPPVSWAEERDAPNCAAALRMELARPVFLGGRVSMHTRPGHLRPGSQTGVSMHTRPGCLRPGSRTGQGWGS